VRVWCPVNVPLPILARVMACRIVSPASHSFDPSQVALSRYELASLRRCCASQCNRREGYLAVGGCQRELRVRSALIGQSSRSGGSSHGDRIATLALLSSSTLSSVGATRRCPSSLPSPSARNRSRNCAWAPTMQTSHDAMPSSRGDRQHARPCQIDDRGCREVAGNQPDVRRFRNAFKTVSRIVSALM